MSEKKMVSLMADLQLADAYSGMHYYGSDGEEQRLALARSVLSSHGVTQEQLDTTLAWYGRNMDDYSELFAKVDRELLIRKKRMMKEDASSANIMDGDNLWPYGKNGVISSLGLSNGWTISLPAPEMEKGERLRWAFHLAEYADYSAALGVEYTDGSGETTTLNRSGNVSFEMTLQTDTAKNVERIYGSFRLKNRNSLPLFADSIRLERLPFDSLEYKNFRQQKRYAAPRHIEVKKDKKDAEKSDSIQNLDSVKTLNRNEDIPLPERKPHPEKVRKERITERTVTPVR
ncbi:MAG: DUF4296 domain-containing protein [Muribaculaceae bacterium]|nr:DUF4296 domain-containing protein [Muribaculaceae bacterium]